MYLSEESVTLLDNTEMLWSLPSWTFINNSDDARNPPSEPYRDLPVDAGCSLTVHDPHVLEYPGVGISHELSDVVRGDDVVAILTGHDEYT
ncbi:MAG: UDP binding domain-containing protein [ANME-2 cluster archaeon]|nr:UDP binding domain-containing protein [ANME-2 cluster archaeon]